MSKTPLVDLLVELANYIRVYIRMQVDYLKLDISEKTIRIASMVIANGVAFLGGFIFLNIGFIALTLFIGSLFQAWDIAVLIIGAFYFLIGLFLILFRNKLTDILRENITRSMFPPDPSPEQMHEGPENPNMRRDPENSDDGEGSVDERDLEENPDVDEDDSDEELK